jgi:hypothetical protein
MVSFTPTASGTRTGTLSIASNDPSHPIVSVNLQGVGYAIAPVPQITSLTSQLVHAGAAETNFTVQGYGFLPSSIVEVNGVPQQTVYHSSTYLSANLAASSIPANSYGELAVTVVTPAPGGGTSAPYALTEFRLLSVTSSFMLYEPVSMQLFVSTPAIATANPNTILPINPGNATAGVPIPVGNDPGILAASADGKYLYVALNADHSIQRINLATNAIERTFPLPVDSQFGNLTVFDMHVVPGNDTDVVASLSANDSPSEDGIAFFNDGGLVNWIPGLPQSNHAPTVSVDRFTFTNNPSTLYAITPFSAGFAEFTYSPTGLQYAGNICCVPANGSQSRGAHLVTDGTLLYTDTGLVWNPANSGQLTQTYPIPASTFFESVVPDANTNKTYYLNEDGQYSQYQATTILAFDQTSLAETGSLSFTMNTGIPFIPGTQLVRWGTNGFAFRASNLFGSPGTSVLLFSSSIASASNLNPAPVAATLAPASTPATGADFILTVNGSGFIPGSTVEWNGSPRLTTVVSSTQITATIYASDIAATGVAQVVVMSPGQGGGASAALSFTITAPLPVPIATLSPASLTFASQAIGTSSSAQTVTLTNSGNGDLTGIAIAFTGANAGSFAQTSTCGSTVNAGKSCLISVVFTPASAGSSSAALAVTDNAATSPQSISLSGTAPLPPSAPIATLSPASLTFASQAIGASSSAQMATLTNSGNADLTGITIALTGANAGSFAQTSTCGTTVSAGKSCLISVVFTPASTGSASATLVVTDNAATSPQSIGLSGTASQTPFVIAPQAGSSTASTITAGQHATYFLSITPAIGYSGTIALTCSNLPTNASCSFAPSNLALAGGNSATFTVTIATEAAQTAALLRNVSLGSVLAGFMFLLPFSKNHRRGLTLIATALLLFAVTIGVSACGGGPSGSGTTVTQPQAVAPGTYTVQAVASDGTTKQMQPLTLIVQ